jgi:peptidoglycan-associated lipoprotein
MRRVVVLVLATAGLAALAGCPKKPTGGECKTSQDCLEQEGFGKVCVEGRCQECGQDSDCKEGFVCRGNKCVPKPECTRDADCPQGQRCDAEKCVAARDAAAEEEEARRRAAAARPAVPPECADASSFTIRFGFDQATLTADSQGSLQKLADCVKQAPAKRITIAGHADERGTTQYNIALGSRRAESARKYLADLGVGSGLETVSFGEEKPVCTDASEECWARNRRGEFQIER